MNSSIAQTSATDLVTFDQLPDDAIVLILEYAFVGLNKSVGLFEMALAIRVMSQRLRKIITTEIFAPIIELSGDLVSLIDDRLIRFFPGLKRLCLPWYARGITSRFDQLTRLEFLDCSNGSLTNDALRHLTTLRALELTSSKSKNITNYGITTLTNLTSLKLGKNMLIDDIGLATIAPFLNHLTLKSPAICGSCFVLMTRLQSLEIKYPASIDNEMLLYVAPTLERLLLSINYITCECFSKMTRLQELTVFRYIESWASLAVLSNTLTKLSICHIYSNHINDTSPILSLSRLQDLTIKNASPILDNTLLAQMTSLTKLDICRYDSITDTVLISLSQLKTLCVHAGITGKALINMRERLEVIELPFQPHIHWCDLVFCTSLKTVEIFNFKQLNAPMTKEALEKETGIRFITIC